MSSNPSTPNRQVMRTRAWILEATILLMDEKPYNKITVSDITEKAGIARQTFYRNYRDKDEIVLEYMMNSFTTELLTIETNSGKKKRDEIVLRFNLEYLRTQHGNLVKLLSSVEIENLVLSKFNEWLVSLADQYKGKLAQGAFFVYRYKVYYQISGMMRVLLDWYKNNMPIQVGELEKLLNYLTVDTKARYANMPNIVIQIGDAQTFVKN